MGDRILLDEFAKMLGVKDDIGLMRLIDKKDKMKREEFVKALQEFGLNEEDINKVFTLIELKGKPDDVLPKARELFTSEIAKEELKKIEELFELLKAYGIEDYALIDFGIARGFDYYTSIVFEAIADNDLGIGSIGGGGRYDNLIEVFGGKPTPATGFAIGIERLIPILESKRLLPEFKIGSDVFVAYIGKELEIKKKAIEVTQMLRKAKIRAEYDIQGRKLSKALNYANSIGAKVVIILGKKDLAEGKVTIRDMESGEQVAVPIKKAVEEAKKML